MLVLFIDASLESPPRDLLEFCDYSKFLLALVLGLLNLSCSFFPNDPDSDDYRLFALALATFYVLRPLIPVFPLLCETFNFGTPPAGISLATVLNLPSSNPLTLIGTFVINLHTPSCKCMYASPNTLSEPSLTPLSGFSAVPTKAWKSFLVMWSILPSAM